MWPTRGPPVSCRPQVGPIWAPWTLLSGYIASENRNCNRIPETFSQWCWIALRCLEYLIEQFTEFTNHKNHRKPQLLIKYICKCFLTLTFRGFLGVIDVKVMGFIAYHAMRLNHHITDLTVLVQWFTVGCNKEDFTIRAQYTRPSRPLLTRWRNFKMASEISRSLAHFECSCLYRRLHDFVNVGNWRFFLFKTTIALCYIGCN